MDPADASGILTKQWAMSPLRRTQETVPDPDALLAELRHKVETWCNRRCDASGLSIQVAYQQLVRLDVRERSFLRKQKHNALARAEIVRAFDTRRQLLRSRALDLSRDRLRPLKIADLPPELLHMAFRYLQAPKEIPICHTIAGQYAHDGSSRQDVRNARLVCRLFRDLATPLLFSVLCLQLSQSSLDVLDRISRIPAMATGVRVVRLSLAYRPREYADNISHYMHARFSGLGRHRVHVETQLKSPPTSSTRDGEASEAPNPAELQQALKNHTILQEQWASYVSTVELRLRTVGLRRSARNLKPPSEYQQILQNGHDEFRRLREEQLRLLRDGSFANDLASAISRMPNARSFNFLYEETDETVNPAYSASLLNNAEILSRFMARPLSQEELEFGSDGVRGSPELESASLLWKVPIALHKEGAGLTEIVVSHIPLDGNFSMFYSQSQSSWRELGAACASLEVFDYQDALGRRYEPDTAKNKSYIFNYVGAMLSQSGQHLRVVDLNFGGRSWPTVVPVLFKLSEMPRIQHLGLVRMKLQQRSFNALCDNLGNGLKSLRLSRIRLRDGGWAQPVDVLRKKMAAATRAARRQRWAISRTIVVSSLSGEELNDPRGSLRSRKHQLMTETAEYIYGTRKVNPFKT